MNLKRLAQLVEMPSPVFPSDMKPMFYGDIRAASFLGSTNTSDDGPAVTLHLVYVKVREPTCPVPVKSGTTLGNRKSGKGRISSQRQGKYFPSWKESIIMHRRAACQRQRRSMPPNGKSDFVSSGRRKPPSRPSTRKPPNKSLPFLDRTLYSIDSPPSPWPSSLSG